MRLNNSYIFVKDEQIVIIRCTDCGRIFEIPCTDEQHKMLKDQSIAIQNIFPELDPGMRELFLTGMCNDCFDNLFDVDKEE